jgi:hypothetical protein
MSEVANIYDNGPISPIARIQDKVAVWTESKWFPYRIVYIEGIPLSSPFRIDLCMISGAYVALAANGQVANTATTVLQMNQNELCHYRWFPLDDVEGGLWELNNMPRYNPKGAQARTSRFTDRYDPYLATTTFWILGNQKDVALGCWNPWGVAQVAARFCFFGYRYILEGPLPAAELNSPITYLPAQGR